MVKLHLFASRSAPVFKQASLDKPAGSQNPKGGWTPNSFSKAWVVVTPLSVNLREVAIAVAPNAKPAKWVDWGFMLRMISLVDIVKEVAQSLSKNRMLHKKLKHTKMVHPLLNGILTSLDGGICDNGKLWVTRAMRGISLIVAFPCSLHYPL